jgi:RNA polymerase sigma-70 factor (family 1)
VITATMDDTALLVAFQALDPGAEKMVFQRFFRPLCVYGERITGDMTATEDLVAEAFEKCMDRRAEFKSLENCKAFLYRAVRNSCINYTMSERYHQSVRAEIRYLAQGEPNEERADDLEIVRAELMQEIYAEIEALPGRCREIFKLIFFEGLSTDDISERMGISAQTVRSQKARAIQLIKTEMLKKDLFLSFLLLLALLEGF